MRLPRFTAETPPPRESGMARATDIGALTRTGATEVWRGVSQLGGAIKEAAGLAFQVQQQKQKISDDTQTDKISQNMQIWAGEQEEAFKKFLIETPDDQDKALAEFTKSYNKMVEQELKDASPGVQKNVKSLSSQMYPHLYNNARKISSAKFVDYTITTESEMAATEARAGDIDAANKRIDGLYKNGLIGLKDATIRKNKLKEIVNQDLIDDIHEAAKVMPYEEAIQFLNDIKGIDKADRNDLIARRKRQNEIETATTNRKVRWDALRKVSEDPDSVTDDYIEGLVKPNSLTWDDAEEIKKIRDTEHHPLKSSRYKLYSGVLDSLYRDVLKPKEGEEIDPKRILEYDQKSEETKHFFETNPDVTPEGAKKFFDELAGEAKSNFLDRLWEGFMIGTGARGILPEKKEVDTVIMISPDGRRYTVPKEKRQLFIDNGYKEG